MDAAQADPRIPNPGAAAGSRWLDPCVLLATCGWIGRAPVASGTFGAAAGLPLAFLLPALGARVAPSLGIGIPACEALLVAAICLIGVPLCSRAAAVLGRGKDPGAIVFDEFASMPLAILALPPESRTPFALAVAFLLLRVFDIGKPFPCRWLEGLRSGLGIMADDWAAAAWTAACLAVARGLGWL